MIIINDLGKTIHGNQILDGIHIKLEPGRIYGLQGKNGSGKTMLMRAISGLIKPTKGFVEIDGKVLGKDIIFPESIGILIENPSFIPNYSGFKNLSVLADIRNKIGWEEICRIMEDVGLNPKEKKSYRKYSLGMKQRLGIACAFMESPDIILLDEPINALDTDGIELVRALLYTAKKRNAVIVAACHDKEELELIADEIFVMECGRVTGHRLTTGEELYGKEKM